MALTPKQRKRLRIALVNAFGSYDKLKIMVGEGEWDGRTDVSLESISREDSMDSVVYQLIDWSMREHRVKQLIRNAQEANGSNPHLQKIASEVLALSDDVVEQYAEQESEAPSLTADEKRRFRKNTLIAIVFALVCLVWGISVFGWQVLVGLGSVMALLATNVLLKTALWKWFRASVRRGLLWKWSTHLLVGGLITFALFTVLFAPLVVHPSESIRQATAISGEDGKQNSIVPGQWEWYFWPLNREISIEALGYIPRTIRVFPWRTNRIRLENLQVMPYVIYQPDDHLLARIPGEFEDRDLQWDLTIEGPRQQTFHGKYFGSPIWLGGGSRLRPSPPAGFAAKRHGELDPPPKILLHPGDEVRIELKEPRGEVHSWKDLIHQPRELADAIKVKILNPDFSSPRSP